MLGRRRNKRRIYLAFFHREFTPDNPIKYHTAFLVTPKRPNTISEAKNSRIFHVRRDLLNGREERWIFDPKPTRTRSYLLAGVMLLGKVPNAISADALEAIFESVPRLTAPRDNPRWLCRDWIWSALPVRICEACNRRPSLIGIADFSCRKCYQTSPIRSKRCVEDWLGVYRGSEGANALQPYSLLRRAWSENRE